MSLENVSIKDLQIRKSILENIICEYAEDPRVVEPIRQLGVIEKEIENRTEPKGVAVSLDSLNIAATKD